MKRLRKLCRTHLRLLMNVRNQLSYKQTMTGTQLILSEENTNRLNEAKELINKAITLLEDIE